MEFIQELISFQEGVPNDKARGIFKKLYPFLLGFYALFNIAWGIYYIVQAKPYYYILAFCSLLFIPIVELFYKLLHFKPVYQLNAFIYIFIFMLYILRPCPTVYSCGSLL